MDSNATLTAIRSIVKKTYADGGASTGDLAHLVDLVEALDAALSTGGPTPDRLGLGFGAVGPAQCP